MKKWMAWVLAIALAGTLTACGSGEKQEDSANVDLQAFYSNVEEACGWEEGYMVDIEGEMLESYYPGIGDLSLKQFVAKMPMMSAAVNEVVFLQCETEEDADRAEEILQARIDYQVGDENNPGGAWYPESIEAWKKGQVHQDGTYVAMIASAESQSEIEELWDKLF